jgi:hypothetical protein
MANNQKKLKAFVRYDGSGRVVASSLILRKNKPRVGRWYEIPEYLCCNGTTNTTTTQGGGGGTPTAWFGQISATGSSDAWKACNGAGNSIIVYTSSTSIGSGTYFYSDAALTTVIPYAFGSISIQGTVYEIENGRVNPLSSGQSCAGITTTTSTTQALTLYNGDYSFNPAGNICNGTGQFNLPVLFPNGLCASGTVNLAPGYTWSQYGISSGSTVRLKDPSTSNIIQINIGSGSSAFSFGCTASC